MEERATQQTSPNVDTITSNAIFVKCANFYYFFYSKSVNLVYFFPYQISVWAKI